MNYFRATFYDRYTPLNEEQILQKLTPPYAASGASPVSDALEGKTLRIVLDDGPALEYAFSRDTLTLVEGGGAPVEAPYTAKELGEIVLLTHLIPGTVRGYNVVVDRETGLATVFEVWFCGFEQDKREVRRHCSFGYIDTGAPAPSARHGLTNRIEGLGTWWKNDDGAELLYFFPSVVWSSFVELSDPRGGITRTAPSDYIKISDRYYIYSRAEQEFSGAFTLEVLDLFSVRHIGVRLGFDLSDALDYKVYEGSGEITGRCANLESLTDYGTEIPFDEAQRKMLDGLKGARPQYRPRFLHRDYTKDEVDAIVRENTRAFAGQSIMSGFNTMEVSGYLAGRRFTLRYDDGPAWEYDVMDSSRLKWRTEGEDGWHEETYQCFEPARDIFLFAHICTGSDPLRCLTHAVDFSNALTTCVDAALDNGRKPWEVGHRAIFGVLEMTGGPTPPAVRRHGFTTDLVGKAYAWTYSDFMQSIHVYSTPESYSWTIMLPKNAGGVMWSSPCFYVKLRDDAYLMSWTEDACNGNQGTFILNPRIMHDAGFFFGIGDTEAAHDVHLTALGAYARPLGEFELKRFF
ncbi:Molybdenum cofactor biosynthesis protein F [Sporobacter termitidis DSM 10068]|uniref:Molybdenum cofactor biosynthesis protein F n=1 Tax=Sporobacter termitidis DSM 10068 TaxID=1123282 RepID=A0A1M5YYJ9_9FIRM|nr:MoaF N-terminal domain-containing protein [Sporobacter termitidis]SHI17055.1 Molybdenum cofactor biosynthesis protein F [Sporobacter termitidis DSM 10068]